jgi:hypothetical protein
MAVPLTAATITEVNVLQQAAVVTAAAVVAAVPVLTAAVHDAIPACATASPLPFDG